MNKELRKELLKELKRECSFNNKVHSITGICFFKAYPKKKYRYTYPIFEMWKFKEIESSINKIYSYKINNRLNNNQFLDMLQNLSFIK